MNTNTTITNEQIADLFEANEINSPYSTSFDLPKVETTGFSGKKRMDYQRAWVAVPEIVAAVEGREGWELEVADILSKRKMNDLIEKRRASYEAVEHPAIRAMLLSDIDARGRKDAEKSDLTDMVNHLVKSAEGRGKTAYQPEPGCKAKLHLKEAIHFGYSQEAYADMIYYAIPATIEKGADLSICNRNLQRLSKAMQTHNGLAGSGSTYDFSIHQSDEGDFVVLSQRASISD